MLTPQDCVLCPVCGHVMIERRRRGTDRVFWGCSQYPRCRGTREIACHDPDPGNGDEIEDWSAFE